MKYYLQNQNYCWKKHQPSYQRESLSFKTQNPERESFTCRFDSCRHHAIYYCCFCRYPFCKIVSSNLSIPYFVALAIIADKIVFPTACICTSTVNIIFPIKRKKWWCIVFSYTSSLLFTFLYCFLMLFIIAPEFSLPVLHWFHPDSHIPVHIIIFAFNYHKVKI